MGELTIGDGTASPDRARGSLPTETTGSTRHRARAPELHLCQCCAHAPDPSLYHPPPSLKPTTGAWFRTPRSRRSSSSCFALRNSWCWKTWRTSVRSVSVATWMRVRRGTCTSWVCTTIGLPIKKNNTNKEARRQLSDTDHPLCEASVPRGGPGPDLQPPLCHGGVRRPMRVVPAVATKGRLHAGHRHRGKRPCIAYPYSVQ